LTIFYMKLKKGDNVLVIAGKSRGKSGTIVRAMPSDSTVLIDGLNMVKRHRKPTSQSRAGQIVEKPMPIHASNVMLIDPKDGKPTRVRIDRKDGGRSRIAVRSGQTIK
ncbi:MAG TPA: 50S ribosomal protein L24, partial [Candidatus Paceibacterota bacterium]|nr:50S ribosomal protein L24 [Candidatus Paceibacterota bacterium]